MLLGCREDILESAASWTGHKFRAHERSAERLEPLNAFVEVDTSERHDEFLSLRRVG